MLRIGRGQFSIIIALPREEGQYSSLYTCALPWPGQDASRQNGLIYPDYRQGARLRSGAALLQGRGVHVASCAKRLHPANFPPCVNGLFTPIRAHAHHDLEHQFPSAEITAPQTDRHARSAGYSLPAGDESP